MERKRTPVFGIKGKLISACCMLLVAVIMVVSSTYAWFTLSTAPAVTGISTAIGANGALEIRLNGASGDVNATFGNLVDLGDEKYGLDSVILRPSMLVLDEDGKVNNRFLVIPQYNEYGRPTTTPGERTEAGIFVGGKFVANADSTGVRAVGVASGLTDRQLAYRNAKYAASTNSSLATNKAASSLNTNGSVLGNVVIKKATVQGATYTAAEIASLQAIVNDLKGTADSTGVLQYIESAYEQMIIAFAASAKLDEIVGTDIALADAIYSTVKTNITSGDLTLANIAEADAIVITVGEADYTFDLAGTPILAGIKALIATQANVAAAQTAIDELDATKTDYEWAEVKEILNYLIVTDKVTVNGMTAGEINADMDGFASSVLSNGINIEMHDGAGVYVEIADHCSNYSAAVTMTDIDVKGVHFDKLTANMATKSTQNPAYLTAAQSAVTAAGEPSGTTTDVQPMTEFYGYIIDLVFRTNAANSNLLLQTEAIDRIYEDNNNELTQGLGSTMTYASTDKNFTTEQVKGLMECIRIVFFDTETRDVLAYAMLDVAGSTVGADGVTANIYLYETVIDHYVYTPEGADSVNYYVDTTDATSFKYYTDAEKATEVTDDVVAAFGDTAKTEIPAQFTAIKVNVALNGEKDADNAPVITALAQNQEVKVSTLVYLDGEALDNTDVPATSATSVMGTMNLQFSSSADLVPMEYGDLHIK